MARILDESPEARTPETGEAAGEGAGDGAGVEDGVETGCAAGVVVATTAGAVVEAGTSLLATGVGSPQVWPSL
jgi:hypothetical protein